MNTAEFMELWGDRELRQFIVDESRKYSGREDIREEYIQEAWLCISCAPADCEDCFYRTIAHKAIYSGYWQQYKEHMMLRGFLDLSGNAIVQEEYDRD